MKQTIQAIQANLDQLALFAATYDFSDVPKDLLSLSATAHTANITILASCAPNDDGRLKLLSIIGDRLGREGWEAMYERYSNHYNWSRTIGLVEVTIHGAEKLDRPEKFPVSPTKFPVMLENVKLHSDDNIPF